MAEVSSQFIPSRSAQAKPSRASATVGGPRVTPPLSNAPTLAVTIPRRAW